MQGSKRTEVGTTTTPKFNNPPVAETVIGVQFPELVGFRAAHFGLYWQTIKDRYPKTVDQGRLPSALERFPRNIELAAPHVRLSPRTTPERVWYVAPSDSDLIQVQPDRFLFNWRRRTDVPEPYFSYRVNSRKFVDEFGKFGRFCEQTESLERPIPKQCEVTYINHIKPRAEESVIELFGKVFTGLRWELVEGKLPAPESTTFNRVYVIEEGNSRIGRLYAEASVACQRNEGGGHEFILLRVTARVNQTCPTREKLEESLQLAHDWVVNGFADITDPGIQKDQWERTA